jgi:uncharacterized membrane protein YkoI
MHHSARWFTVALSLAGPTAARAQQPAVAVKAEQPGLLAQARITPDSATRIAQARLPRARVRQAEIEVENGRLLYSFDMKVPGRSGIEEVQVDAKTGRVVGVEHEDAAAEARERKADSIRTRP